MSKILHDAMGDYYKARAGSHHGVLMKELTNLSSLAGLYFAESRKKALKRLENFDVSTIPKSLQLWNASGVDMFSEEFNELNRRMDKAKRRPNKNTSEIMAIQKEYEKVLSVVNKMPSFFTEAKANAGDGEENREYSAGSSDNYINQIVNETYDIYKNDRGEYMIRLFTDTADGELVDYEGTLEDFDDMIFLERKDLGDGVVNIMNDMTKKKVYEAGALQQSISEIIGKKESLLSAFWDDIFQLTSGPFNSTTLSGQFAADNGFDEAKMNEYKIHTAEHRNLSTEEQGDRLNEMAMYVHEKLNILSQTRWQNYQSATGTKGGKTKIEETSALGIQKFKEETTPVKLGGGAYSVLPRLINITLDKLESQDGQVVSGWDGSYYRFFNGQWHEGDAAAARWPRRQKKVDKEISKDPNAVGTIYNWQPVDMRYILQNLALHDFKTTGYQDQGSVGGGGGSGAYDNL